MLDDIIDKLSIEIVQKTQIAFADNQYPGDENLVEDPEYWEAINLSEQLKGKDWRAVPLEVLNKYRFNLSLFTPEAFHYYLPAFILASVLFSDQVDTLPDNLIYNLTPPEKDGLDMDKFLKIAKSFKTSQKEVIREFIKLYVTLETSYQDLNIERVTKFWNECDYPPIS
jgi:hypothetical protein